MGFSWVFGGYEPFRPSVSRYAFDDLHGKTHNHFLILTHSNAFPLDDLQILQAAQDIVLHPESSLHAELRALFDGEGLRLQRLNGAGGG